MRPDGCSGESARYGEAAVYVIFCVTLDCWSPMSRLIHKSVPLISRLFAPGLSAEVTSARNGAFQTMPSDLPFTVTSAMFFTLPKSRINLLLALNQSAGASTLFV